MMMVMSDEEDEEDGRNDDWEGGEEGRSTRVRARALSPSLPSLHSHARHPKELTRRSWKATRRPMPTEARVAT